MVIGDLHVVRVAILPVEHDPELVIDADAVKARQRSFESFQSIAGRYHQIPQLMGGIE